MNTRALQSYVDILDDALTVWDGRDDDSPQPGVRAAANTAVDAVDALLGELHSMRSAVLSEIRVCDTANAARTDALLTRVKDNTMATPLPFPYTLTLSGSCAACRADTARRVPRNARWTRPAGNGTVLRLCQTHREADEATKQRCDAAGIARATRNGGVR